MRIPSRKYNSILRELYRGLSLFTSSLLVTSYPFQKVRRIMNDINVTTSHASDTAVTLNSKKKFAKVII